MLKDIQLRRYTIFVAAFSVCFFSNAHALECPHTKDQSQKVDAQNAKVIELDVGAGLLTVEGVKDLKEVHIEAHYCADEPRDLEAMSVSLAQGDGTVSIKTNIPSHGIFGGSGRKRIGLKVRVPNTSKLRIRDTSGSVIVDKVAGVEINDGSGGLYIKGVDGNVKVRDTSGEVRVENVQGSLELTDSSGAITIKKIADNVRILNDSSGSIEITNVGGNVTIDEDSSGSIYVAYVGGDFRVDNDSSGKIVHKSIAGHIQLPSE